MTRRKDPGPDAAKADVELPITEPSVEAPAATPVDSVMSDPEMVEPVMTEPGTSSLPLPAPRRSGILGPLLGGAIAAIGGFVLSHFNVFGLAAPDYSADVAALVAQSEQSQTAALGSIKDELSALAERVSTLEARPAPELPDLTKLDDLERRLGAIEAMPSDGTASNAAVTAKITQLEQRIAALPATGSTPELQAELDAALSRLGEAEAAATARAAEAEAAAVAMARESALRGLAEAVTAGQPYSVELEALDDPALTDTLGATAETGVPTLATLQADFPDAARVALQTSREISTDDGWSDRLVDFLASQTGARSLTPQEGTTPDAILSRAEFALSEGRVADALSELQSLDPAVQAPLDSWVSDANAYVAAQTALNTVRGE
jgi:hypothetical protein